MQESWVLDIKRQCNAARVPFFFKQWGGVQKSKAGRLLRGKTYDEMPPRESHPVAAATARKAMIASVEQWIIERKPEPDELLQVSC